MIPKEYQHNKTKKDLYLMGLDPKLIDDIAQTIDKEIDRYIRCTQVYAIDAMELYHWLLKQVRAKYIKDTKLIDYNSLLDQFGLRSEAE